MSDLITRLEEAAAAQPVLLTMPPQSTALAVLLREAPKPERPLFLDMEFGEALARFAQTKPEEVTPAPGQTKKAARPTKKSGGPVEPTD